MMIHFFITRLLHQDNLTSHRRQARGAFPRLKFVQKISSQTAISAQKTAHGFSTFFVLHLKLSPLGDLGLDIDENYCDGQLRDQNFFWFLKSSSEIKTVHFTRFVEKTYPRPQAVSSKDKIPFEEPH